MEARNVIELYEKLDHEGIEIWIDGGWGVDALLGEQTRPHKDLDVIVRVDDVTHLKNFLGKQGFKFVDGIPTSFVLKDPTREVDVHAVKYDKQGNGIYRMRNGEDWVYPAEGFTGRGKVEGIEVRCLSANAQMLGHTGYKPSEKDFREMELLHDRFGVNYPEQYNNRFNREEKI